MAATLTACGGASDIAFTDIPPLYTIASADVTLTAGLAVGDLLLIFNSFGYQGVGPFGASDTAGNTYYLNGTAVGGIVFSRIEHALSAGAFITVFFPVGFFGPTPINHAAGLQLFKISGVTVPAFASGSDFAAYFDINDEDGGASSTYRPATGGPNPDAGFATSLASFKFQNNAGSREEVCFVFYILEGRHPSSPGSWALAADWPPPDTPAAPAGFSGPTSVTGRRNLGGGPPIWTQNSLYVFTRNPLPDNTAVDTDALSFGGSTYRWELEWLTLSFPGPPPEGGGPWNLETRGGQYHIAYAQDGHLKYRRSESTYPPFETLETVPGGGDDSEPRMWEENEPRGRVRLFWKRTGALLATYTDDDGDTFETPVELWPDTPAPDHATGNYDPLSGYTVYLASISGTLEARVQGPADSSPGAAFAPSGLPTVDADTTFHVFPATDEEGRWLLVLQSGGDILNFVSTDEAATWTAA